jgi:hypothetical protein
LLTHQQSTASIPSVYKKPSACELLHPSSFLLLFSYWLHVIFSPVCFHVSSFTVLLLLLWLFFLCFHWLCASHKCWSLIISLHFPSYSLLALSFILSLHLLSCSPFIILHYQFLLYHFLSYGFHQCFLAAPLIFFQFSCFARVWSREEQLYRWSSCYSTNISNGVWCSLCMYCHFFTCFMFCIW